MGEEIIVIGARFITKLQLFRALSLILATAYPIMVALTVRAGKKERKSFTYYLLIALDCLFFVFLYWEMLIS